MLSAAMKSAEARNITICRRALYHLLPAPASPAHRRAVEDSHFFDDRLLLEALPRSLQVANHPKRSLNAAVTFQRRRGTHVHILDMPTSVFCIANCGGIVREVPSGPLCYHIHLDIIRRRHVGVSDNRSWCIIPTTRPFKSFASPLASAF